MDTQSVEILFGNIGGNALESQKAVREIFAQILERFQSDLIMLTGFIRKDEKFMQNLGESLALSSQWYIRVLGHKATIENWEGEWNQFINAASNLYHIKFLDLYHTVEGMYDFLTAKTSVPDSTKSEIQVFDEKMALHKEKYQEFTMKFAQFYSELLAEAAKAQITLPSKQQDTLANDILHTS